VHTPLLSVLRNLGDLCNPLFGLVTHAELQCLRAQTLARVGGAAPSHNLGIGKPFHHDPQDLRTWFTDHSLNAVKLPAEQLLDDCAGQPSRFAAQRAPASPK
jgi:hypothetical protein